MRALVLILALAAAPAAAQDLNSPTTQLQIDELRMQQQLAQQRAVAQHNELMALDARIRTEQAAAAIQSQRAPTILPQLPYPGAPPAGMAASRLPRIPDTALADSNRRVREISGNRE